MQLGVALLGVGGRNLAVLSSAGTESRAGEAEAAWVALTVPSACPTAIWLAAGEAAIWVTSPDTLPHWDITGTSILTCRGKERGGEQAASHWRQEGSGGGRRQAAAAVERREAWTAALIISGGCLSPAMALTSTACLTIHTDTFSGAAESRCLPLRS